MSIAGGLPRAVDRAAAAGCDALQIFTKSTGQWRARPLPPDETRAFRRRVRQAGLRAVLAHASYLVNLASVQPAIRRRSIESLDEELTRAEALGLDGLVLHPGSFTSGTEEGGLSLAAEALRTLLAGRPRRKTRILLENTAGQGTNLGHRFEQLATLIDRVGGSRRIAICLDSCHLLAAGYRIDTAMGYRATMRAFDAIVGLDRLAAWHLNDSKRAAGSRVDRHEQIGLGHVGRPGFRRIVSDPRFRRLPMILETPKAGGRQAGGAAVADPLDLVNLSTLRALARRS